MARLPPLNALKCFEAAARWQSFSKSAEELHVTQSAVSHQIRQLEQWFGITLFDRQGRQTVPTPDGAEFAQALSVSFSNIEAACRRFAQSDGKTSITIAAIPSIATIWLIPRLPAFSQEHPAIGVRMMHAIYGQPVDFDDVDLAIIYGDRAEAPPGAEVLLPGVSVPVCSPNYLKLTGPVTEPKDMLVRSLLHDLDRQHWLRWFVTAGVKGPAVPQGTLFEGFNLLHSALLAGQGIGLAPTAILSDDLKAGRLVKLFETETLHEMGYFIVEPSQHRNSRARAIETFKQWLLEQAKA